MTSVNHSEGDREEYSFIYGDEAVSYQVIRKAAMADKARKITIKVTPKGEATVTAPMDAERASIHSAVMKRAKWIADALAEFKTHREYVQKKHYVSGEMQFYLGRRYLLKVIKQSDALSTVKMQGGKLLVTLSKSAQDKPELAKAMVKQWYQHRAELVFRQRLATLLPQATWVKGIPSVRILAMQKQWGSCSAKGNILLNPHLIKAPKECIDYVIVHELCHLEEYNHSERFWRLLSTVMPNWREVKSRLDSMAELYLNE